MACVQASECFCNAQLQLNLKPSRRIVFLLLVSFHRPCRIMNRTKTQYSSLTAPEISRSDWYNRISPWTLEVTAAVFSALCISTITLILWSINGKPYEAWQLLRTDITPNTLLSIVSTLAKSSLLLTIAAGLGQAKWLHLQKDRRLADIQAFDEATRGPLGALRLLWRTRLRALLAAVGCMLTILVLATEPFVQQILTYSSVIGVASNETCAVAAMSTMPGPGLRSGEAGLLGTFAMRSQQTHAKLNL